jgi:2-oxoglutarate ferredoxin oxidoreductase subunit beta
VTFNLTNTHDFFKERIKKLEDDGHDTSDWKTACEKAMLFGDEIYTGVFYEGDRASLEDVEPVLKEGGPLAYRKLGLEKDDAQKIIDRMM